MALPKLVKATKPIYIPSLGKEAMFEPFTTEDEKSIVLLEQTASSYEKCLVQLNILKKCCQDQSINLDELSIIEITYLFLRLRAISYSEVIELETECPKCKTHIKLNVHINDIKLDATALKPLKLTLNTTDGVYIVTATQYTVEDLKHMDFEHITLDDGALVLRQMMKSDGNDIIDLTVEEKRELFNQLDIKDAQKIAEYINSNTKLTYNISLECPECGEKIEGELQDFFI